MAKNGIYHEMTAPHSPFHFGVAKRNNRAISETIRAIIHDYNLPKTYGVKHATMILNIIPHTHLKGDFPLKRLFDKSFDLITLRTFGEEFFKIINDFFEKMEKCELKCKFIVYENHQETYRLIDGNGKIHHVSRNGSLLSEIHVSSQP